MVENAISKVGDKEVCESIVVVIRCGYTHPIALSLHTGLLRDVREGTIMVVLEKTIPKLWGTLVRDLTIRLGILELGSIDKEYI
jgi:hypothetical protein